MVHLIPLPANNNKVLSTRGVRVLMKMGMNSWPLKIEMVSYGAQMVVNQDLQKC